MGEMVYNWLEDKMRSLVWLVRKFGRITKQLFRNLYQIQLEDQSEDYA